MTLKQTQQQFSLKENNNSSTQRSASASFIKTTKTNDTNESDNKERVYLDKIKALKNENKKLIAGILAILIGGFGIHKFILGYNKEGVIQILLSFLCGVGAIIGLIEGIIYLTKSDEEFYQTYQVEKKGWF